MLDPKLIGEVIDAAIDIAEKAEGRAIRELELIADRDTWKARAEFSYQQRSNLETQRDELLAALEDITARIKDHPAYAELSQDEELTIGGDTAEFSYLARLADSAIAKAKP